MNVFVKTAWSSALTPIALFLVSGLVSNWSAEADELLNGAPQRPFYIFGHNPNTTDLVYKDLHNGANALEPDVSVLASDLCPSDPTTLEDLVDCDTDTGSGCYCYGVDAATTFTNWLDELHTKVYAAQQKTAGYDAYYNNLALIVFDCKSPVDVYGNGVMLLRAIRQRLNVDLNPPIRIILSTPNVSAGSNLFAGFNQSSTNLDYVLRTNEALMVDGEPYVQDVLDLFHGTLGFTGSVCYGAGSSAGPNDLYAPSLPRRIDAAVWHRAAYYDLQLVTYAYLIPSSDMGYYIDAGVDGLIVADSDIATLLGVVQNRSDVFLATRAVSPFTSGPPETYALEVTTGTDSGAGTDANLTFTLNGTGKQASATVDTSAHLGYDIVGSRMENGDTDYVTIMSTNLGSLASIAIYNDDTGLGPDWKCASINVYSARWLAAGCGHSYRVYPNAWINGGTTQTNNLTFISGLPDIFFSLYHTNAPFGSSQTFPATPDTFWYEYDSILCPGGTLHFGAGTYTNITRLAKPGRFVRQIDNPAEYYPLNGSVRLTP